MKRTDSLDVRRLVTLWVALLVFFAIATGGSGAEYPEPDLSTEFIEASDLSLADGVRDQLLTSLAALARNFHDDKVVTPRLRAQAIAVGLQINPRHRDLLGAHLQWKRGIPPDELEFNGDAMVISEQLWQMADGLTKTGEDADANLAVHLMDISTALDRENEDAMLDFELYRQDGHELSWSDVFLVDDDGGASTDLNPEGAIRMPAGSGDASFKKKQSKIRGLLVVDLDGKDDAGKASEMNATASAAATDGEDWNGRVRFNQDVGDMMSSALVEVGKFLELRHGGWPQDHAVEISFENHYNPKDGPSAAVACALLLDSLVDGYGIDERFAVTGDMNADGAVQPIGGVDAKIRGATKKDCELIAIPIQNVRDVEDLVLMEGIEPIHRIQIFSLESFEEALGIARKDRRAEVEEGIVSFGEIQNVLSRSDGERLLTHPQVVARLREVVEKVPNHLSARILYGKAVGRGAKKLSIRGSLDYIDRYMAPANRALKGKRLDERTGLQDDEFADAASALSRLRPRLDDRALDYVDALEDYLRLIRSFVNNRPTSSNGMRRLVGEISTQGDQVDGEYDKLMNNASVIEELDR
ncbi:MAG: S16 family serine protease [Verrucomicrobiota bacterium]